MRKGKSLEGRYREEHRRFVGWDPSRIDGWMGRYIMVFDNREERVVLLKKSGIGMVKRRD